MTEMNNREMILATQWASKRVADLCDRAAAVAGDVRRDERLTKHECKACFYFSRIGGAAMTSSKCAGCGDEMMHGSTAVDALCMSCATKQKLCKHCGGDLEMRTRRRTLFDVGGS